MGFLSEHKQLLDGQKELLRQLKEVLQRRREELTHIMAEKKAIGTFLNMCRKVQASVTGSALRKQFSSGGNSRKCNFCWKPLIRFYPYTIGRMGRDGENKPGASGAVGECLCVKWHS